MSQFLSSFVVRQWKDGIHWSLYDSLIYWDDVKGKIVVPTGFSTDGGSIPKLFQNIFNPYGIGFRAFVVHDYLYYSQIFTKLESDECLKRALAACGENIFTQFTAVLLGGQEEWDAHTKNGDLEKAKRGIYPMENNT